MSTQVRKYASTLKTSAILVASLVGLWLGIIGQVSASTESEKVTVQPIPSAEDCDHKVIPIIIGFPEYPDSVVGRLLTITERYVSGRITFDKFKTDMNAVLVSPDLINCGVPHGTGTIAHYIGALLVRKNGDMSFTFYRSDRVEKAAEWIVSKGLDLTHRSHMWMHRSSGINHLTPDVSWYYVTPYEYYKARISEWFHGSEHPSILASLAGLAKIAKIFEHPLLPATKPCSEIDGLSPFVHEYCIVAENLQSSIETEVSQSLRRLIGVDYLYKAERYLSGTALYPGYKATITFTCAPGIQNCGPAYVPGDRWSDNFLNLVKRTFGLGVKCSDSGNLLDVDSIEPGESVSVTHSSDTERSSPWYRNCEAISGGPFTLSIKTTRLAK